MAWTEAQSGIIHPQVVFGTSTVNAGTDLGDLTGTGGIVIPFAATDSYTSAKSGDIRELLYSMLDATFESVNPATGANAPSNFSIKRSYASSSETSAQKTFTVTFQLNSTNTTYDVKDE